MRVHKKKHGAQRLEACGNIVIGDLRKEGNSSEELFGNGNPIRIEIGCGKGDFIVGTAAKEPDVNFLAVEKVSDVLVTAAEKIKNSGVTNVRVCCVDAKELAEIFPEKSIDRIYLNFSDPWPKDRHAKRRLPSRQFLERFDHILKADGTLEFKTDNRDLFDFAVEEVKPAGWEIAGITYDLHHDETMNRGNVMTEYEEKFSSKGNPIYKYIIFREH